MDVRFRFGRVVVPSTALDTASDKSKYSGRGRRRAGLDEVANEAGELTELGGDVVRISPRASSREHVKALLIGHQQLDVGAHRGQEGS